MGTSLISYDDAVVDPSTDLIYQSDDMWDGFMTTKDMLSHIGLELAIEY